MAEESTSLGTAVVIREFVVSARYTRHSLEEFTQVAEATMLGLQHLDRMYGNCIQVFAEGSADRELNARTAAFLISGMNISWAARLDHLMSSTRAECIAIEAALKKIKSRALRAAILLDSKSTLQLLHFEFPANKTRQRFLRLLQHINKNGHIVCFKWAPSHVGVLGNEAADKLAREVTWLQTNVEFPKSLLKNTFDLLAAQQVRFLTGQPTAVLRNARPSATNWPALNIR